MENEEKKEMIKYNEWLIWQSVSAFCIHIVYLCMRSVSCLMLWPQIVDNNSSARDATRSCFARVQFSFCICCLSVCSVVWSKWVYSTLDYGYHCQSVTQLSQIRFNQIKFVVKYASGIFNSFVGSHFVCLVISRECFVSMSLLFSVGF